MNREQLNRINELTGRIEGMRKIIALQGEKLRVSEFPGLQSRHIGDAQPVEHGVVIDSDVLRTALVMYINAIVVELRDLGFEE